MTSTEKKYCWNVGGVVYGKSREAQRVYQEHFLKSVSRLSYVCFCGPSPMGNGYICSEQAQHRARMISSHTATWWHFCSVLRRALLQASAQLVTQSVWIVFWNVVQEQQLHPFYWQKVQALGPDYLGRDQFVHWFVHRSTEKHISCSVVVHEWHLLQVEGNFQQSKEPYLGRSKPSCCICSLPPTTLCSQCLGRHLGFTCYPDSSAQIDWVFLEENLP